MPIDTRIRAGAARCVTPCRCAVVAVAAGGVVRVVVSLSAGRGAESVRSGGFDSLFEPPSAKIWNSLAMPPFDEVGVPPTVIAMYCLPSTE